MQLVVLQKQPLQRRQIIEGARLNLPQMIVMQVQLFEPWQSRECTRRDVVDAILIQVEYPQIRRTSKRTRRQVSNVIVVQQQGVQFIKPMKCSRAYFHDIVKPKIPEKIWDVDVDAKTETIKVVEVSSLPYFANSKLYLQMSINDNEHEY